MASLLSADGELQLDIRLLGTFVDPFQQDLEWFEYQVSVEAGSRAEMTEASSRPIMRTQAAGEMNRKELNDLLRGMQELAEHSRSMRFEPSDLKFYLEWSHETPSVYLIIVWFDLAIVTRTLEQRFPAAHAGYRFLTDASSLVGFRRQVEFEFLGGKHRGATV